VLHLGNNQIKDGTSLNFLRTFFEKCYLINSIINIEKAFKKKRPNKLKKELILG